MTNNQTTPAVQAVGMFIVGGIWLTLIPLTINYFLHTQYPVSVVMSFTISGIMAWIAYSISKGFMTYYFSEEILDE